MEQDTKQKIINFASSEHLSGAVELLKLCRTTLSTVISKDEFSTLVNAITLEKESELISRLIIAIDNLRSGDSSIFNV
jgi:hypothetical protein